MGRPETVDAPVGLTPSLIPRVDQLQAGYGRKQVVFDVDLEVHRGEIVGVLGHNGSGKTTTIRTILGLNPVIGGRIEFRGKDATRSNRGSTSRPGWR